MAAEGPLAAGADAALSTAKVHVLINVTAATNRMSLCQTAFNSSRVDTVAATAIDVDVIRILASGKSADILE